METVRQLHRHLRLLALRHQTTMALPLLIRDSRSMVDHLLDNNHSTLPRLLLMAPLLDNNLPTAHLPDNNLPMVHLMAHPLPTAHRQVSNLLMAHLPDKLHMVPLTASTVRPSTNNNPMVPLKIITVAPHHLLPSVSHLEPQFAHLAGMPSTTKALSVGTM